MSTKPVVAVEVERDPAVAICADRGNYIQISFNGDIDPRLQALLKELYPNGLVGFKYEKKDTDGKKISGSFGGITIVPSRPKTASTSTFKAMVF